MKKAKYLLLIFVCTPVIIIIWLYTPYIVHEDRMSQII
jgi:hypothetical protein